MSKKKKPKYGEGQIVRGEILPTMKINWSPSASEMAADEWTHGPLRPVTVAEQPAGKKRSNPAGRKSSHRANLINEVA
jgi:hypothetical protein